MFFSWAARVVAILILALTALRALLIVFVLIMPGDQDDNVREFLGNPPVGRHIDRVIYAAILGVALGTLAEVSFSLRAIRDKT